MHEPKEQLQLLLQGVLVKKQNLPAIKQGTPYTKFAMEQLDFLNYYYYYY